ncbi:hypothetical protein ASG23_11360 [Cellulomonas sp. Leaf395]|nr:hypothetical protein ASG23_11360 [Cellulomonas sp. Leaf395]
MASLQFGPPTSDGHWVPPLPDDLPRSPTGRVPQWVVDERTGVTVDPQVWRPDTSVSSTWEPRPRRRRRLGATVGIAALLAGSWWLTSGTPGLPDGVVSSLPAALGRVTRPEPTAEVRALADAAHLSPEGRELLFDARTEILGAAEFAGRCAGVGLPAVRADGAVGCYLGVENAIIAYAPADARLRGYLVETIAHETLHAAWGRLDPAEQARLSALLETVASTVPTDDRIHTQIAESVGARPENRPTELFAYIGTQVWRDGGLDPELEAVYARFVSDRAALVAVHTGWAGMLDEMLTAAQTASDALVAQEEANAGARAQLTADRDSLDFYRREYQSKVEEVDSMPASQRQRTRLSWTWWDGTVLPMAPADQTLATAATLLARDEAALPARDSALTAAEAAAAVERTRVEALIADYEDLSRVLDPGAQPG